ncbi:putative Ent-kaurene oxidase [Amylocarpus encephaloides]|uniref:Ent-kaurene oxidase n=1 Tax=Amylocarpus encephaloides TaxID=45428 RepID=A0A9P8C4H7_9HELO|nr:putative Ent-kaurene oxidase [Amylocarpus encephaloides]
MVLLTNIHWILVLIAVILSLAIWIYLRLFSLYSLPSNLPWAGVYDHGILSRPRAVLRSLLGTRGLLDESYTKYSKNDLIYVLPNFLTGPEVIIPLSMMDWLLQQPDSVLNQGEINRDFLQADHTMLHQKVITDTVHADVIRKELTRNLGLFTGDVIEEVDFAFRKAWGVDEKDWKTVGAYDTMTEVIARISNRVLVGLPLCRNEDYLYHTSRFARLIVLRSAVISLFPNFLKPFIAPLVTYTDYRHYLGMTKYTMLIWKQRISDPNQDDKQKSDYFQWSLDHANAERDPEERGSNMITKRLTAISFAAIQSSVITSSNLMFDLAAYKGTASLFDRIQEQISAVLETENGTWNKTSLSRMTILDSVLCESMRLGGFVSRGVLKAVVAKEGVKLPSGEHLPYGAKVGIQAYPIHYDEKIYPRAHEFDPLRFYTPGGHDNGDGKSKFSKNKRSPLVTTSPHFMGFSHGRHSCPGRFFASQQLKIVLAYVATNYEIEPLETRPANNWFVGSSGPPLHATIRIRRRRNTV